MNIKIALKAFVFAMSVFLLNGCSNDDYMTNKNDIEIVTSRHTVKLSLNCTKQGFDSNGVSTRATSTTTWQNGDRIYLRFSNGATTTQGNAVYNAPENAWYINYYGSLTRDKEMSVEVYYFENPESVSEEEVKLSPTSAVFHDAEAKYIYPSEGDLTVTTTLSPTTSRVRFKGTFGYEFVVEDIICNETFSLSDFSMKTVTSIYANVEFDNYTPYYYMNIDGNNQGSLKLRYDEDHVFTKYIDGNRFVIGKSGWLNSPTISSHDGWDYVDESFIDYNVNGVIFRMIRVKSGSFIMGDNNSPHSNDKPAHKVTLTKDYYIGETEVTQELWEAVMGSNPVVGTSSIVVQSRGSDHPICMVTYEQSLEFLNKLSMLTGTSFTLPTQAEWEFAAKGGRKTLGYIYSGSNDVSNVAWYNTDYHNFPVKNKMPNELGLYDMSGNVGEMCLDWAYTYPAEDQIDPVGPLQGRQMVVRGGDVINGEDVCRTSCRGGDGIPSQKNVLIGFRLCYK